MNGTSTYVHALRIWLATQGPHWPYRENATRFDALVHKAEAAGWRFTTRTRLETALRHLLAEEA